MSDKKNSAGEIKSALDKIEREGSHAPKKTNARHYRSAKSISAPLKPELQDEIKKKGERYHEDMAERMKMTLVIVGIVVSVLSIVYYNLPEEGRSEMVEGIVLSFCLLGLIAARAKVKK